MCYITFNISFFTNISFVQTKFIRTTTLISTCYNSMWISYHCRLIFLALHCTGYFSVYLQCLCFVKMFLQWKSSIQSTFLWEPCSLLVTLLKGKLLKMYYKAASVPCFILSHHETFKKMGMHYVKYRWKTLSKVRRTQQICFMYITSSACF